MPDLLADTPVALLRHSQPITVPPGVWVSLPWDTAVADIHAGHSPGQPHQYANPKPGNYLAAVALDLPPMPCRGAAHLEIVWHVGDRAVSSGAFVQDIGPIPDPEDPTGPKQCEHERTLLRAEGFNYPIADWEWVEARFLLRLAEPRNVHLPPSALTQFEIQWMGP